ncbi:MAG: sodium:proton antiporter [Spirochaetaceae bacterium]|nr:MAG: sodium:proton antiporter [Spirochaetaceae bacterium]
MMQTAAYLTAAGVFAIGLYGMLTQRDMIKICISISIMDSSFVMALVAAAYVPGGAAPIAGFEALRFVDPLPHALALTAIVIGAGILAIALALTVAVYRHYGTTDIARLFIATREDS